MTPNEQSFIDAAILRDQAIHQYNRAASAALGVRSDSGIRVAALKARNDAAKVASDASIEFDKARKRVTAPHLPK